MTKFCLKSWLVLAAAAFVFSSTLVRADDNGSYQGYDAIVSELKDAANAPEPKPEQLNWNQVALHAGLALATSYLSTTAPNGVAGSGLMKGFSLSAGMNLFTPEARAEAAFRSYAEDTFSQSMQAQLHELEVSLVFLPPLSHLTSMRMGVGLAERYLSLDARNSGVWSNYQESTPSSLFLIGFEHQITPGFTLGPDLSYRTAFISNTIDKSGWDASLRLNATF